jgi:hypothetical protein
MSAQCFNGVRVEGAADQLKIINESDKPVIGYAVQRITDAGVNADSGRSGALIPTEVGH